MEKRTLTSEIIDQQMNKAVESKLLKIADWNRAIRIKNTQNFFDVDKGIFSVKVHPKNNRKYYILRVQGTKEPTIKKLERIIAGNTSSDDKFYFMVSDEKYSHREVLGNMIIKYEL